MCGGGSSFLVNMRISETKPAVARIMMIMRGGRAAGGMAEPMVWVGWWEGFVAQWEVSGE